jgi:hypothetical protein
LRYIRNGPDWQITPRRPMRGRLKTGLITGSFCNNESAWMVLGKRVFAEWHITAAHF